MVTCKKFQWNIVIWLINIKYFEKVVAEERCRLMISGCNQRFDCTCMSKYKHCLKLQCTCTQLISTRCCLQLYMHLLYLETEGTRVLINIVVGKYMYMHKQHQIANCYWKVFSDYMYNQRSPMLQKMTQRRSFFFFLCIKERLKRNRVSESFCVCK